MYEDIKIIIQTHYPGIQIAILTGSYLSKNHYTPYSDIDIVLLDQNFSGVTSEVIISAGRRIDFTRINYYDIGNVLCKDLYSSKGIIINMLSQGILLFGNNKLFTKIKSKAVKYQANGTLLRKNEQNRLVRLATKQIKDFKKDFGDIHIFFLLTEFSDIVISNHISINGHKWYGEENFRKLSLISETKEGKILLKSLFLNIKKFINDGHIDRIFIKGHLNKILNNKYIHSINETHCPILVIDLQYKKQSKVNFWGHIIPNLLNHPYLSTYFFMGKFNNENEIHKFKYSLFFYDFDGGLNSAMIQKSLIDLLKIINNPVSEISIQEGYYYSNLLQPNFLGIIKVLRIVTIELTKIFKANKNFNTIECFLFTYIVTKIVADSCQIPNDLKLRLSEILVSKWNIPSLSKDYKFDEIKNNNTDFLFKHNRTYELNSNIYKSIASVDIADLDLHGIDFNSIKYKIKNCFSEFESITSSSINSHNLFTISSNSKNTMNCLISILEFTLAITSLDFKQKLDIAYCIRHH